MREFISGIILIVAGGLISLGVPLRLKNKIHMFFTVAGAVCVFASSLPVLMAGKIYSDVFLLPRPFADIRVTMDPLSAFFVFIISILTFTGAVYSSGYLKGYTNKPGAIGGHYFFASLLYASMMLVSTVHNALGFLFAWEMMSLSSLFLVCFEHTKKESLRAGITYMVAMHVGVLFLFTAFMLIYSKSGSFDFTSFKAVFETNPRFTGFVFALFFIGFGIKAGFIPLHTWLPVAHPAAPSNISAVMSGVMIKTGIYGILRILSLIPDPPAEIGYWIFAVSGCSVCLGVIYAVAQQDMKRLLAYCSVENIGIIGMGIGLGALGLSYKNYGMAVLGFSGGILHVFNHSLFKGLLFFGAGAVYQNTHTRNIELMGGVIKSMPYTAAFFLIGSLAVSGIPPFNGFISEFLIYSGLLSGLHTSSMFLLVVSFAGIIVLSAAGILALVCFTKIFGIVFLGNPRDTMHSSLSETGGLMLAPMAFLAFLCIFIGLFPRVCLLIIQSPVLTFVPASLYPAGNIHELRIVELPGRYMLLFTGIVSLLYWLRCSCLKKRRISRSLTWGCGYSPYNTRMQYSGSSYAGTVLDIVKPCAAVSIEQKLPAGLFPRYASFGATREDMFGRFYGKAISAAVKFFSLFRWIQSGSTQLYILYGLIFLGIALLWIVFFP